MWSELKIEKELKSKLIKELKDDGEALYGYYTIVRKNLCDDILPEIKAKLPDYTDHGFKHVHAVMQNAELLLDDDIKMLSSIELFCLLMSVLFHDTGNYKGRENHRENIEEIYSYARNDSKKYRMEQRVVCEIVKAHCGKAKDDTYDTLKYVRTNMIHDTQHPVNAQSLAALLRFADELAEGKNRTSLYRLLEDDYEKSSIIHHKYASISNVFIDKKNNRIALTYNIDIADNLDITMIEELLNYIYKRIIKLDKERRYTKHYCNLLIPFTKTTIVINFNYKDRIIETDLEDLVLTDLVLPNDSSREIHEYNSGYRVNNILDLLKVKIENINMKIKEEI